MTKIIDEIKENIFLIIITIIIYCAIIAGYMFFKHNDIVSSILTSTLHLFFLSLFVSLFNIKSNLLKYILWLTVIPFLIVILFLNINDGSYTTLFILVLIFLINLVKYFLRKQAKQQQ